MSTGDPLIFTYSSGFGALALQLKQTKDQFCSNWASLDWGKREWPPIGTIGGGGVRGVKYGIPQTSNICHINCTSCSGPTKFPSCEIFLRAKSEKRAAIRSICYCKLSPLFRENRIGGFVSILAHSPAHTNTP